MSYLVLARKWRPRRFAELVGQTHVVRALTNALASGRVHHAFLFTGTRGVGKTTIARIFAKSLNCEQGPSTEPCGQCNACRDIDAGRFVDLLEIDAASHTGVDNVRDLIDNAQYMPARGRVKVYLIDEVHMLSKPAFNALLKTLEEPPGHVKFLLATTDPEKLPVTVLSRCLQFNLKRLDVEQIEGQIAHILDAEGIASDGPARRLLAKAADGSLRDALSLLDQAIAYGGGTLAEASVREMLGSVDRHRVDALLRALIATDGPALLAEVTALAELAPDFGSVLDEIASVLHRIQVRQLVPETGERDGDSELLAIAQSVEPELIQLWYRMALEGRSELPMAPSPQVGFEMALLRMLAFCPRSGAGTPVASPASQAATPTAGSPARGRGAVEAVGPSASTEPRSMTGVPAAHPAADAGNATNAGPGGHDSTRSAAGTASGSGSMTLNDHEDWLRLQARAGLRGPARELAANSAFGEYREGVLRLHLPADFSVLAEPVVVGSLAEALAPWLGSVPKIAIGAVAEVAAETYSDRVRKERDERRAQAEQQFRSDPTVRHLVEHYDAQVVADSIQPIDDN